MNVPLCEGCDKELIGKRRGATAHNSTCRSRKRRKRLAAEAEPEFCPSCGGTCRHLDAATGWCPACTRELKQVAA